MSREDTEFDGLDETSEETEEIEGEPEGFSSGDEAEEEEDVPEDERKHAPGVDEHFDDAIKLYLKEIQKSKLLTAEGERELATLIATGDMAARDKMIESNLRLVVKIAKRYMNRGLPFLDLIEEGNLGLIKAVERFKISKECRFSTYATWWIRQSIERALVNQSRTIRLPVHVADDINKYVKVSRELLQVLKRDPELEEVAEAMGTDITHVRRLTTLIKKTYSIEHPMGENSDYSLIDTIKDVKALDPLDFSEDLDKFQHVSQWLETLTQSEREILTLRFGLDDQEPQTLDTIGKKFGVTRERIRQIESKSLEKLRKIREENESGIKSEESDS